jgi:hypothetical protein
VWREREKEDDKQKKREVRYSQKKKRAYLKESEGDPQRPCHDGCKEGVEGIRISPFFCAATEDVKTTRYCNVSIQGVASTIGKRGRERIRTRARGKRSLNRGVFQREESEVVIEKKKTQ